MRSFLTVLAMACALPAWADSAGEMLARCRSIQYADAVGENIQLPDIASAVCFGAFAPIQEMVMWVRDAKNPKKTTYYGVCVPPNVRRSQMIAVFVKYAEQKPNRWHESFVNFALESLSDAFPCK